ncbi:MAG: thiamine phosphate synthase [Cyanobacteria bacterium P01_F01_bin.153]
MQKIVLRILDANLDRAREGVRTVEEWCRFGLNDGELTGLCKEIRQELGLWHSAEMRAARDTEGDAGTALTHSQEARRSHLGAVVQASLCRVQEALRVLEEYGKLSSPEMGSAFKQLRYQAYVLDSRLQEALLEVVYEDRMERLRRSPVYLVTSPDDRLVEIVEQALQGGLSLVQYRDKNSDDGLRLERARALKEVCDRYGALFLVNDRVDLAIAVDADGVHVGQQDLPVPMVRELLGPGKIVGCSTTSPEEMERAIAWGADYIGVGPVHATPTKPGKAASGLDYVRYALENAPMPWFAIGGLDLRTAGATYEAGARGIAVVRAIMAADSPKTATEKLLAIAQESRQ